MEAHVGFPPRRRHPHAHLEALSHSACCLICFPVIRARGQGDRGMAQERT